MANNRCVYQQETTVSVPKNDLREYVIYNQELSKKDLRVFLLLLTELDGWQEPKRGTVNDPNNFRIIKVETIADRLDMKEKDVKNSLKSLKRYGIIERGDSHSGTNGYRFTF